MKFDGNNGIEVIEAHQRWVDEELDENGVVRDDLRADFSGADLRGALMPDMCLYGAIFRDANLFCADLTKSDLSKAEMTGSNIYLARLEGASLQGATGVPYVPLWCPDTGAFIGWKQAVLKSTGDRVIVKLLIPEDAERTSDLRRECRADKVKVLEIQTIGGEVLIDEHTRTGDCAISIKHSEVEYIVGEETRAVNAYFEDFQRFEHNQWHYNNGIFFFTNRRDAVLYLTGGEDPERKPIAIDFEKMKSELEKEEEEKRHPGEVTAP